MTVQEAVNLAVQRFQGGDVGQAAEICRLILAQEPRQADALQMLGMAHLQAGDARTAVELIGRAAALGPGRIDFHYNLGRAQSASNQLGEAAMSFRRAAAIPSQDAFVLISIAKELSMIGEFADALAISQRAAAAHRNDADVLAFYAQALTDMARHGEALEVVRRAISIRPEDAGTHWNLAMLLLRRGEFNEGWREFEWRFKLANFQNLVRDFGQPQWAGGTAPEKTILLHAEGGFGETIFYIRYLPRIRERLGRIIIECQAALIPLVERMQGIERIIARGKPLPTFDLHIPMPSLAGIFDTDVTAIQISVPYLSVPPERLEKWGKRMARDRRLNVGLAWKGHQTGADDMRSMSVNDLAPLASVGNVRFFSLQMDNDSPPSRPEWVEWVDYTRELRDFADTAGLMSGLDLIISVDTSVPHLAGALGKPVWMLVPLVPSYHWLLDRADTPWYPTMTLFRQTKLKDWSGPMMEVARKLGELAARRVAGAA